MPCTVSDCPGSSPLARGTRTDQVAEVQFTWLIPARAGNTHSTKPASVSVAAHPRSRGEHTERVSAVQGVLGSSPLARGTPNLADITAKNARLIPARAGNTR